MLVILASRFDEPSSKLVDEWAGHDPRLMTPADLSSEGWKDRVGSQDGEGSSAVVSGRRVEVEDIDGVLVRLPYILEAELGRVIRADREYVAAEMTAYLVSWLTRLKCPVVNAPTAAGLIGPGWRPERWVRAAVGVGMRVRPVRIGWGYGGRSQRRGAEPRREVTVVGKRVLGKVGTRTARQLRALAAAAGVKTLTAYFDGGGDGDPALVQMSAWPRIEDLDVREAILKALLGRDGAGRTRAGSGRA
jgi:hypothetical protein